MFDGLAPFGVDTGIEEDDDSAVFFGADESSESLAEFDDHGRERIFGKAVAIESGACEEYRIGWDSEWELVDDEDFEIVSGDVDPFPETIRPEEGGGFGVFAEVFDHASPSSGESLGEKPYPLFFEREVDLEEGFFDARKRREETEGLAPDGSDDVADKSIDCYPIDTVTDISDVRWDEDERLRTVIEIGGENLLLK